MKILLAHNFYRSSAPSGEDSVYRNERDLLEKHFDVIRFEKYNDDLDDSTLAKKVKLALSGAWSKDSYRELAELIKREKPDIAHFHNTFPQITPSSWSACRDSGVPVVQTIHNFRYICPGALLQREGKPCELCIQGTVLNALKHRCYRDSLSASAAQTWTIVRNRINGSFTNQVNRYLALTDFSASRLATGGLPRDKILVKPNFLPDIPEPGKGSGGYVVYTGRLSEEKGVKTLLRAWKRLDAPPPLKLLGDGPLRRELEAYAATHRINAEFLGYRSSGEVLETVREALFQIVPSEWYEGFPMVILEAYACGTPVLAADIGSLSEVVKEGVTGYRFRSGDVKDLRDKVLEILSDPTQFERLRDTTRSEFLQRYTAKTNIEVVSRIYQDVMEENARLQSGKGSPGTVP